MQNRDRRSGPLAIARRRRRLWLVALLLVLSAVAGWCLWAAVFRRDLRLADERLAEIEAARAIPDSENAALIYSQLLQDPNTTSILDDFPESPAGDVLGRVLREPWLSKDHPELAGWIKEHQFIIDRLFEAARFEGCRFPVNIDVVIPPTEMDRAASMRQWGFLLSIAANNDLAEGRIDAAMVKWRCLLRMEDHLHQQPAVVDHLLAGTIARLALESIARFIVTGGATESHLREIDALVPAEDHWAEQLQSVRLVESLRLQKLKEPFGPLDRIQYHVMSFRTKRAINSTFGRMARGSPLDHSANEYLCIIRGSRILIALKRHQIAKRRWPQSLDEVKSSLSRETLTDPLNRGQFVYRPAGNTFVLYSKGKNNIDEHGKRDPDASVDDWPIWPPHAQSPTPKPADTNGV